MKFLQIMGRCGNGSFYSFEFEDHNTDNVCCGDQIWSDGHEVEIADYADKENLDYLISMVENRLAFKGALRRVGIYND